MSEIIVYGNWREAEPEEIGSLFAEHSRGHESFSFMYHPEWLKNGGQVYLDPDLGLYQGRQYVPLNKSLFGLFSDSCPDRWGRVLLQRRERILAEQEGRKPKRLLESDYLIGIYDESRMGALRFKTEKNGAFLSDDREMATPPWATLRSLEEASREFEKDENLLEDKWLKQLLGPGSSLGGARPKANVLDSEGSLWIAKFPSRHDEVDCGAWEKVTHDLAVLCGLQTAPARLERFSTLGSTFLIKRFDREGTRRIHFSSAMTMLGKTDGASANAGASYLEIVSFLKANGASPKEDLKELWRRIVFSMAVSNTDDHLRNHGFLLTEHGWRLSPLYDVNPSPYGDHLSLCVNETDSELSLELAIAAAPYYGLSTPDAAVLGREIVQLVQEKWEVLAKSHGISRGSIDYMRPAFGMLT